LLALLFCQLLLSPLLVVFLLAFVVCGISIFSIAFLRIISFFRSDFLHRGVLLSLFHFQGGLLVEPLENLHKLGVGVGGLQFFYLICVGVFKLNFFALLISPVRLWIGSLHWL